MAKRKRVLPARKPQRDRSRDDESLLMRSAETLGRMIGTLQRQLDGATKRLARAADDRPSSKRKTAAKKKTATAGATQKRAAKRSAKKR